MVVQTLDLLGYCKQTSRKHVTCAGKCCLFPTHFFVFSCFSFNQYFVENYNLTYVRCRNMPLLHNFSLLLLL